MGNNIRRLFLAMPVFRFLDIATAQSQMLLQAEQMTKQEFGLTAKFHVGECPIGRARNDLTHEFLQSDCTHILFIDADIVFNYDQVKKILMSDEDIVGGFYVKKQDGPVSPVCNTLNSVDQPREDGLVRVKYMGTGFLRISRRVFEVMIQKKKMDLAYLDDRDGKTVKYDFWRMGVYDDFRRAGLNADKVPDNFQYDESLIDSIISQGFTKEQAKIIYWRRWLSEDWQFCQFAIECGFPIWADASILLEHCGSIRFPLKTQLPELYSPAQLERMGLIKPISAKPPENGADSAGEPSLNSPSVAAPA